MLANFIASITRTICGLNPRFQSDLNFKTQKIYFANHSSHLDFLVIWASLPEEARNQCRPVAAADYWGKGKLKPRIARDYFNAILVTRLPEEGEVHPIELMQRAIKASASLILFPEGTRSLDGNISSFKAGLYYLAKESPKVDLVPVILDNLNRILPKGEFLPVPILAAIKFGSPIFLGENESKDQFLDRARNCLLELKNAR